MSVKKKSFENDSYEASTINFELIEFTLYRHLASGQKLIGKYGVNVAKVREVVSLPKINPLGATIKDIAGLFELRGVPIPAVKLCQVLGDPIIENHPKQQVIVTEFSQKRAGFIVHSTTRIRRVAWDKVMPPSTDASSYITGMILIENQEFLFILDLEKILVNIEARAHPEDSDGGIWRPSNRSPERPAMPSKNAPCILLVDDSRLILGNASRALMHEGYRVILANNGEEALDLTKEVLSGKNPSYQKIDAVVTDIEMPRLNGIALTARLRDIPEMAKTPILLHTSLDGNASKEAAKQAGADGYVVKNDVLNIIETLKQLLHQDQYSIAN